MRPKVPDVMSYLKPPSHADLARHARLGSSPTGRPFGVTRGRDYNRRTSPFYPMGLPSVARKTSQNRSRLAKGNPGGRFNSTGVLKLGMGGKWDESKHPRRADGRFA